MIYKDNNMIEGVYIVQKKCDSWIVNETYLLPSENAVI